MKHTLHSERLEKEYKTNEAVSKAINDALDFIKENELDRLDKVIAIKVHLKDAGLKIIQSRKTD